MPFGLANSPATYQRLMEQCLGELHLSICFIYLDDVIVFADTYEEHLRRLERVLKRFRETGLKLSAKKCSFFKRRVKYVGHIVSEDGIEPDPDKIQKVTDWPRPTTPEEVRRFLGFVGYYRRFIEGFAKIARPLTDLMPTPSIKTKKRHKKQTNIKKQWKWGQAEEEAFNTLKQRLTSYPILAYPDFSKPFELHTDASLVGLGAILYQELDGRKRVIAYASRGLSRSERNYPAHKLEFLALKWSVCEKFHDYLYGHQFTAITDNNPLTYVLSTAKLDATSQRWVAALASFNFDIRYRPGKSNTDADTLSRLPALQNETTESEQVITTDSIKALCKGTSTTPLIDTLTTSTEVLKSLTHSIQTDFADMKAAQLSDPVLSIWRDAVAEGKKPAKDELTQGPVNQALYRDFDKLRLINGVLYRRRILDGQERNQMLIPKSQVTSVLKFVHDDMGHQGRDRTISILRDRFFWTGLTNDVDEYIKNCHRCTCRKTPTTQRAPLVSIKSFHPLEIVCMDFLSLETSKGGFENILVITDHFTRYACAIPTRNQTARTTAEAFIKNFVVHYGLPKRIHTDQGPTFESRLMKEICSVTNMDKSHTTPYHPMGNGLCERFNRTLLNMLGTLQPDEKRDWKSHVASMVHAYNCTRQETTGQSPYFLMFGREPRLPVDLAYGIESTDSKEQSLTQYAEALRNRLKSAYELATAHADKAQERQKQQYDKKLKSAAVRPGDLVLVKIVSFDGKHKLADRWENQPYKIISQPNPDIPVYVVEKDSGEGRKRTLHRNLLLPIKSTLLDEKPEIEGPEEPRRPKPAPRKRLRKVSESSSAPTGSTNDSDGDDEAVFAEIVIPEKDVVTDVEDQRPEEESRDEEAKMADEGKEQSGYQEDAPNPENVEGQRDEGQEDTSDGNQTHVQSPPRRSTRVRRPPKWMQTGEYAMSIQTQPDWVQRAEYLRSLAQTGVLGDCTKELTETIFKIVSKDNDG